MLEFLQALFDTSSLPASYQGEPTLFWIHIGAGILTVLVLFMMAFQVLYLYFRRRDLSLRWLFGLLGVFFLAFGTSQAWEAGMIWNGTFRPSSLMHLGTCAVMLLVAGVFRWQLNGDLLYARPSTLSEVKRRLEWEIHERKEAEATIRQINADLAKRIRERTAEIEARNIELQKEVAERRKAEEQMRKAKEAAELANKAKSNFLANMSHEIRTPLTSILGFSSILAKQATGKHQEFARRIEDSGQRLMETLNAILTMAKLETDHKEFEYEALNVADEVKEIIRFLHPQALAKGLTLSFLTEAGAENARARLDRGALNSIMQNLVGNGIKFTQEGGVSVQVSTEWTSSAGHQSSFFKRVCIRVEDTGVGIDQAFMPHLFEAFRQESTGLSRSYEGSGLGLAITRQLVELMGGEIVVESVKGQGSVFSVYLPMVADAVEASTTMDVEIMIEHDDLHARMLIVEDNKDTQFLIQNMLEDVGDVRVASNAEEALREARLTLETSKGAFDLVLIDINLGEGPSGEDVLLELRAIPAYQDVPIAAVTAYALPGDREEFLETGFNAYLSKPFQEDALRALVSELLAH